MRFLVLRKLKKLLKRRKNKMIKRKTERREDSEWAVRFGCDERVELSDKILYGQTENTFYEDKSDLIEYLNSQNRE